MNLRNQEQSKDRELTTMMHNYKKAIEFITEPRDWKQICVIMAKEYPEVFNAVIQKSYADMDSVSELTEIKNFMLDGKKINAIKGIRQLYGFGLKDSKDIIDTIWSAWKNDGVAITTEAITAEAGKHEPY